MSSEQQRTIMRLNHWNEGNGFKEYTEQVSLEKALEHMSDYLEALEQVVLGQWRISQLSKELEEPDATLIGTTAAIINEAIGDVQLLLERARAMVKKEQTAKRTGKTGV